MLAVRLKPVRLETAHDAGWSVESLEAQALAYLGVRSLRGLPLSLPTTTGVPRPLPGGVLAKPKRKAHCTPASLSGSLTAAKVSNSIAHGFPFFFSTLRM
ncbi:MAG TPA: anhydro-N-acetylmuramic acid kinase [Xanthobacteraceae bacterium]